MNWTVLVGLFFIMAGACLSGELFRRGFFADWDEIQHVAERGDNGNTLIVLMVVLAIVGLFLVEGGR